MFLAFSIVFRPPMPTSWRSFSREDGIKANNLKGVRGTCWNQQLVPRLTIRQKKETQKLIFQHQSSSGIFFTCWFHWSCFFGWFFSDTLLVLVFCVAWYPVNATEFHSTAAAQFLGLKLVLCDPKAAARRRGSCLQEVRGWKAHVYRKWICKHVHQLSVQKPTWRWGKALYFYFCVFIEESNKL